MRALLIFAFLGGFFLASANADHCISWSTSVPEVQFDLPTAGGGERRYYVDLYFDMGPGGWAPWPYTYEESNGLPSLQRGDELEDDTCHGAFEPDTLLL